MDDIPTEVLINSEGYGVVPSNSEYVGTFRSVVASAPPVMETDINVISAHNLIEVRQLCFILMFYYTGF